VELLRAEPLIDGHNGLLWALASGKVASMIGVEEAEVVSGRQQRERPPSNAVIDPVPL